MPYLAPYTISLALLLICNNIEGTGNQHFINIYDFYIISTLVGYVYKTHQRSLMLVVNWTGINVNLKRKLHCLI